MNNNGCNINNSCNLQRNSATVFTGSSVGNLEISSPDSRCVINASNNRAQYYAELALKYKNDAKDYRDSAQYYAEQNADVTLAYVDGVKTELQTAINQKQAAGNYALVSEIPTKVSDLTNDSSFATTTEVSTAVGGVIPSQTGNSGKYLTTDGSNVSWSAVDMSSKANIDLTDVNDTGTSKVAGWAMPSDTYESLTFGASGSTYTAPANGYFSCYFRYSTANGWGGAFLLKEGGTSLATDVILGCQEMKGADSNFSYFIPARKGQVLYLNYNGMTADRFDFVYAQGSESEAS